MAELPFAANTAENNEGLEDYSPIPPAEYVASICKSQYKATKKKDGNYLQLQWKVLEGKHKGRIVFDNLNLDNPNPIAVEIANKALNSICKACKKIGVKDSEELHGIPCKITLGISEGTATQAASNTVKGYKPHDETVSESITTQDGPQEQITKPEEPGTQKRKKLPWEK